MSWVKNLAEFADILGIANLYQNVKQSKELDIIKKLAKNQILIIEKMQEIEDKLDKYNNKGDNNYE